MRRLGVAAVGVVVVGILTFGAGAFALYVWPGQKQAPRMPRYARYEVIGLVRAALQQEPTCAAHYKIHWGAAFGGGKWGVGASCYRETEEEPPVDRVLTGASWEAQAIWELVEDTGQIIPLTGQAAELMRPH